jgi:ribosomal protein S18 acetylase RimI-like enzyme
MQFMVIACQGLDETVRAGIRELEDRCNEHEGLHMKLNWLQLKNRLTSEVNDFVVYDGEHLIGFLGLYHFGKPEAEVSAMVHPNYRQQGVFRAMVTAAQDELARRGVPDIVFITERISPAIKPTMEAFGAPYDFSEYLLGLTSMPAMPELPTGVNTRPARPEDIPIMAALDKDAFNIPQEVSLSRFKRILEDDVFENWIITKEGLPIGKIHASRNADEYYIAGFVIAAGERGKGIGGTVLKKFVHHIQRLETETPIVLEVDVKNETALGLYIQSGFEVQTAIDYYRLKI